MDDERLDPTEIEAFARVRDSILERMATAAARARRDPSEVTLVAVSKTVEAARIRAAIVAGFTVLGENRVQEGATKIPDLPGAAWHLLGPLQSNKARRAVELFDVVQSLGSVDLAVRLDRIAGEVRPGRPLPVLLQVNVAGDPAKAGFDEFDVEAALPAILDLPNLAVAGLMTIGRLVETAEEARPTFRALRALAEDLRSRHTGLGAALSMGMTDDFEVAIEEGATHVRVGRAIFGARPAAAVPGITPLS
ncbi:MAG: YggS family pyridoxal phosphate-dependent enzyme [Chloroflexota bacterium]